MKVMHIFHELKFSGAEIMYVSAAPYFQEKGYELYAVATGPKIGEYSTHFIENGYVVYHNPYPFGINIFDKIIYLINLIRFLKNKKIDIVHIHSNSLMWEVSLCAWIIRKRSVYTFHSIFYSRFFSYPIHILQRWSAKNIFGCKFQSISNAVHNHEIKHYHNNTEKTYNWYNHKHFYPAENNEKEKTRAELKINNETLVLISVGGCNEIKRHEEIIKSLPLILNHTESLLYLHIGKGEKEEEEKELAARIGVDNIVRFCGSQIDVRKYLIASDIYLMTSKHEGISITTIEAMACGIPAILYDVPGLRDFNNYGWNSLLIPEDHTTLANAIIWLYLNFDIANQLVKQARLLVNEVYSMNKNVLEITKLYTEKNENN